MISGRKKFKKYKIVIRFVTFAFNVLPNFLSTMFWYLSSPFDGNIARLIKYSYLKTKASNVGDCVYIGRFVSIKNIEKLTLGNNVNIHDSCYLDAFGEITIGNNVSIAHQTSIISFEHTWSDESKTIQRNDSAPNPIYIADDVWVGCGVRILSGSYVNKRVVIAAGSVIKGELESNFIFRGLPIEKLKEI